MNNPEYVSVTISVFNAERYIAEAVESILHQTYPYFELLVANDGSTDRTLEILRGYEAGDKRIRIFDQANAGQAAGINRLLHEAQYPWIVHLDGDDVMFPYRIERQLAFVHENPDLVAAGAFVYYINKNGRVLGQAKNPFVTRDLVCKAMESNRVIWFWFTTMIYRREAALKVGGLQFKGIIQDMDMLNRLVERGPVLVQPEYLSKYRIHSGSISVVKQKPFVQDYRWVRACIIARRSGCSEPTRETYLASERLLPLTRRISLFLSDNAAVFYKKAVVALADDLRVEAWFFGVLSLLIWPPFVIQKVMRRRLSVPLVETNPKR